MVADALQIEYTRFDYELFQSWTGEYRHKKLAFMFALFKVKNNNHIQGVVSGEYGQGKTSSAWAIAKWDARYTRKLLRVYNKRAEQWDKKIKQAKKKGQILIPDEKIIRTDPAVIKAIKFGVQEHIVISPQDPASKNLYKPTRYCPYIIDDALFFTSTAEAGTKQTKGLRKRIAGNRKKNPSNYWIFPNMFKIPSIILEQMDILIHKESIRIGSIIIPSRVIQVKEKFDKERIERYAKYPKFFPSLIRHHPSFVAKIRFPMIKGPKWIAYEEKYEKYKWDDEEGNTKESSKVEMFKKLESILAKNITQVNTQKSREELIYQLIHKTLQRKVKNSGSAEIMAQSFTRQYISWEEEKFAGDLSKSLSASLLDTMELNVELQDDD